MFYGEYIAYSRPVRRDYAVAGATFCTERVWATFVLNIAANRPGRRLGKSAESPPETLQKRAPENQQKRPPEIPAASFFPSLSQEVMSDEIGRLSRPAGSAAADPVEPNPKAHLADGHSAPRLTFAINPER